MGVVSWAEMEHRAASALVALLMFQAVAGGGVSRAGVKLENFECEPFTDRDVQPWIITKPNGRKNGKVGYRAEATGKAGAPSVNNEKYREKLVRWDSMLEGSFDSSGRFEPKNETLHKQFAVELALELQAAAKSENTFRNANTKGSHADDKQTDVGLSSCWISTQIGEKAVQFPFLSVEETTTTSTENGVTKPKRTSEEKQRNLDLRLYFMKMTVCKTERRGRKRDIGEAIGPIIVPSPRRRAPSSASSVSNIMSSSSTKSTSSTKEDDEDKGKSKEVKYVTKCDVKQTMLGLYGCQGRGSYKSKPGVITPFKKPIVMFVPCSIELKRAFAAFM